MLKPKWSFGLVSLFCASAATDASEHTASARSEQMNWFLRMGFPLCEKKLSVECLGADYNVCRRDVAMVSTAGGDVWLRLEDRAAAFGGSEEIRRDVLTIKLCLNHLSLS